MMFIWKKYSFVIILFFLMLAMALYLSFSSSNNEDSSFFITIKDGDSLWSISEHYATQLGIPTMDVMKTIEKENQLTYQWLKSGDELKIPASLINQLDSNHLVFQTE
ncbi:LysM peptidoglycan-binding domain-containing protein [Bacillus sp. FJAT-50079]|uniref:cell division suppressor protein YneA n=1 Tax=Bacillus sp. FJAT-50079 TaxID=2833577 RepID=UPI001BC9B41B|nr:LysM peptidoglycan-binding domain-containing protein [Bacillus sp. FJAT-50079]MBS4207479.1 LysM peptidoglycan-binding domain-containing protein [Bacillus sp. FJAT-50079]